MSRQQSLTVVALGGNAVSPPAGDLSFAGERAAVRRTVAEMLPLAHAGTRLLVVHGNGPQVGRLLSAHRGMESSLDIHVAQTQGELGYLLCEALDEALGRHAAVALVTRVIVDPRDPAFRAPDKPVGPVLPTPPPGEPCAPVAGGSGWRRVVASPRPRAVVETATIRVLLRQRHVVAGGGGGVPLAAGEDVRRPCAAVVDKDWVAALLAVALGARQLIFVTDVPAAYDGFGGPDPRPIRVMRAAEARRRLAAGVFGPGSMGPKVESAAEFAEATGRPAVITAIGDLRAALAGESGTTVTP